MSRTLCVAIEEISPHPNADRLELLSLSNDVTVVAGCHYQVGTLGVYIPDGSLIPGWLAEDLWLCGRGPAMRSLVRIESKNLRGVISPGLFSGSEYERTRDSGWEPWPMWRSWWKVGDDVTHYLGITPP